jgi:hypothetical protein
MKIIDAEIQKIRAVRESISASFGHDPRKLVAYYTKVEPSKQPSKILPRRKTTRAKLSSKR